MSRIRFSPVYSARWTSLSIQFSAITGIVGNDEFEITKKKMRKRGIGAKRKYFSSLSLNFFLPQTTLWFATVSYDGTPFGWEIYATRTTRGCRGSTQCAPWSARTESIPFRIYRWREWAASGRTLEEPPRWAPVTFTPIPCYDYWSSPLLCSNCDVRCARTPQFPQTRSPDSRENSLEFIAFVFIVEQSRHGRGDVTRLNDRYLFLISPF